MGHNTYILNNLPYIFYIINSNMETYLIHLYFNYLLKYLLCLRNLQYLIDFLALFYLLYTYLNQFDY